MGQDTRVSIETFDNPVHVLVTQPGEPRHDRDVPMNSGYEFTVKQGARVELTSIGHEEVSSDEGNTRPTPMDKAHPGQTSETSTLALHEDGQAAKVETEGEDLHNPKGVGVIDGDAEIKENVDRKGKKAR